MPGCIACIPLAWLRVLVLTLSDRVTDLALTLANASLLLVPKSKMWDLDLRKGNCNQVFPLSTNHLAVGHVLLEIVLDPPFYNRSEPSMISLDIINHERFFTSPRAKILATKFRTSV